MLGVRYLKAPPTTHVRHYGGGKLRRSGPGLSFFYFAPTSEIVLVPLESKDVPFVFNEVTSDFQDFTVQGQLTYRIVNPERVSELMNYSIDGHGKYRSEDPDKLGDRLVHAAQIASRAYTQQRTLRQVLTESEGMVDTILASLRGAPTVSMLGVEVLGLTVLAVKPTPEMAKALQADARETLLKQADEAIYARRNAAVEQERMIKENELNTEVAVAQKTRHVMETKMAGEIAVEEQRGVLVERRTANERQEADARAYALRVMLDPLKEVDWKVLLAAGGNADPKLNIALAFRELAENATKIGELNISPDLLSSLVKPPGQ